MTALEDIRVLELTQVMAGPFCGQVLADMGADVIKVEPPGGDSTRRSLGFRMSGDDTAAFLAVNRNKRSLALDLKDEEHRAAFHRLARDADAVRAVILERFDMSLGAGLGRLKGRIFRIGHLGDFNDLMLAGTLCGVEMGLRIAGVPISPGVPAALELLEREAAVPA